MLILDHLSLQIGGQPLFDDADLRVHDGWHVGVVGPNGSGKSTLFRLLLGELSADAGRVRLPEGTRIAHMAQESPGADTSAVEHVLAGHTELMRLQDAVSAAEAAGDGARLGGLHAEIDAVDGYTARNRAEQLMAGLGFAPGDAERPVAAFSGGWRLRLDLARTLMRPSDLMLLDEPTNHLDLDAIIWLEQWLAQYRGTLLLVSHDRDFLDAVVGHVVHIEDRRLVHYRGNYSAFEHQRAERLAAQQAAYEKQQQRVREIEQFVARFRAQASKARQAQSRLKELERMERIAPAHVDSPFRFRFPDAERTSTPLVDLRAVAAGYAQPVLRDIDLTVLPGERIGLLGPNGAGKSTLIRTLAGELAPLAGECTAGEHLRVGYFAQHQVDALAPTASALAHLQREAGSAREQTLRDFLGGFGFSGDDALAPTARLSGGEKARLALALIAWRRPNLLLLDEPTNHLDLEMRHALDLALQEFSGAVILVTHDRHLLRDTADHFRLVADGAVAPFDGDLDDYREWLRRRGARAAAADSGGGRDRRAERRQAARERAAAQPLKRELARLEDALAQQRAELAEIDSALADPALYTAPGRAEERQALLRRQGELRQGIEALETEWLHTAERLQESGDASA